ncbi:MAG: TetR/AcrR family transcriptional regulator [Oscillospiraceae bacterium]
MKQKEKNQMSHDKILHAAIMEFGTKSYERASLNNICNDNMISKGLIYHYFKNKDELYLCCVKSSFDELTSFLSNETYDSKDFSENFNKLLDLRYQFFRNHPHYSNIFFHAVLQPQNHLKEQIKVIRTEFDQFNLLQYKSLLNNITLRDNISQEEALEYFLMFQEMFNGQFQKSIYDNTNFDSLIKAHEAKLSKVLNIMLYGIAKENK